MILLRRTLAVVSVLVGFMLIIVGHAPAIITGLYLICINPVVVLELGRHRPKEDSSPDKIDKRIRNTWLAAILTLLFAGLMVQQFQASDDLGGIFPGYLAVIFGPIGITLLVRAVFLTLAKK
jgi:hypothetical protein